MAVMMKLDLMSRQSKILTFSNRACPTLCQYFQYLMETRPLVEIESGLGPVFLWPGGTRLHFSLPPMQPSSACRSGLATLTRKDE